MVNWNGLGSAMCLVGVGEVGDHLGVDLLVAEEARK